MGIIFARHGETEFNSEERLQGLSNSNLTDKGINQARNLANCLKNYRLIKITSSPLQRSLDTSNIVSEEFGIPVEQSEALKEMCYGSWETQRKADLKILDAWEAREKNRYKFLHPGDYLGTPGESYENLFARISSFLKTLNEELQDPNSYHLMVSHQGVMICVYAYFLNLPEEEIAALRIPNNEIAIVTKDNDKVNFANIVL